MVFENLQYLSMKKGSLFFFCHIEISQMMVRLVMLLVLLKIFQWIRLYQVGFIMFQLIVKKLLKTIFSLKIHLNKKL
jgi:hypothetical protein